MRPITQLAEHVAEIHKVTVSDMRTTARHRKLAYARQEAMAVMHMTGRYSHPAIGDFFNRDHTTSVYAKREVVKRAIKNPMVQRRIFEALRAWENMKADGQFIRRQSIEFKSVRGKA